ncbi:conserved oligomeric Golgi complex subunit 4 [Stomoxys calcitrans]|uniref:conserved oligomeric Golgi complex subunit 4 n=1 Tax=Stomoxys calcitrans TaxID=35570 RepID=UPI0027E35F40|nr:conserved oligomeric Golgi complex subunit 4 [Stomoxys calcitrans]
MDLSAILRDVDFNVDKNIDIALSRIKAEEERVNNELDTLLGKQCKIEARLGGITRATKKMSNVGKDTNKLDDQIVHTAMLATSVSAKVRRLDLARCRVSESQQRVHDLIDLQLCSQGVTTAIVDEDYEVAAAHISRFLDMDLQLLKRTADDVQGSASSISESVRTLETGTSEMRQIAVRRFEEAVKKDDLASVERFFKIFPLLGHHQEGIEKFSKYICTKLATKNQKELRNTMDIAKANKRDHIAYADAMTSLLENTARVIEVNQPIVEAYYGAGHLLEMLKILQRQCDEDVKNLLTTFSKNRQIDLRKQKINDVRARYPNTSSSGASKLGHYRMNSGGSLDKLNPKDIDSTIVEITVMHSRVELYFRFMKRRVAADIEECSEDKTMRNDKIENLNRVLQQSDLRRQTQELLGTYLLFERYFMEESVIKAIALDVHENGQLSSSMVDDVFFILRKSIRRSLTTMSVNGTCAVINNAAASLDNDFVNALKSHLQLGYPSGYIDLTQAYNAIQSSLQQGKLHSSDNEKARVNFLVYLNNADIATEYIDTLWRTMEHEIAGTYSSMTTIEKQLIESCLSELKSVRDTLKACVDFGMQQLRSSAINPRLHPWVDHYLSYKHQLTEDELSAYEAGETFVQYLIVQIDGLLNTFKQFLTPRNYDALISIVASELTLRLEKTIKKCVFNRLGGLVLDQEVRALGAYLASATSWSVRDKMTRLTQIATILNLEKVSEVNEYWNPQNSSELPWRISQNEVKTILTLRSDFRMEDIKRIRF